MKNTADFGWYHRGLLALALVAALSLALVACDSGSGGDDGDAASGANDVQLVEMDTGGGTPGGVDVIEDTAVGEPDICEPHCERLGLHCGPDGCGGSCGECGNLESCQAGQCQTCIPNCRDKQCGDDGCGGSCGECGQYMECDFHRGWCVQSCIPNCAGRSCGPDGCGGSCGDCDPGETCNTVRGRCQTVCEPYCDRRECGTDGCGGVCAPNACTAPLTCDDFTGRCVDECVRQCDGKECGDDGCEGRCGYCPLSQGCNETTFTCEPLPLTCGGVQACLNGCGADDETCQANCRAQAAPGSAGLWDSVESCQEIHCSDTTGADLQTCLGESCSTQLKSCGTDLLCGDPGTSACMSVSSCMGSCPNAACINQCLCQADEPSYQPALELARCLVDACPTFASDCMQQATFPMMGACGMLAMTCMGR